MKNLLFISNQDSISIVLLICIQKINNNLFYIEKESIIHPLKKDNKKFKIIQFKV